MTIFRTTQYVR